MRFHVYPAIVSTTAVALAALAALVAGCAPRPPAPAEPGPAPAQAAVPPDTARPRPDTITVPPVVPVPRDTIPRDTTTVRVCAGGDVMLGSNLDTSWAVRARRTLGRRVPALPRAESLLAPLVPLVSSADVVLLNIEGAIGEGRAPRKCGRRSRSCYAFRQPTRTARAFRTLTSRGAIVGNLANNHSRDVGPDGFVRTRESLERAGVHVTGADSVPTVVVTPRGDTVLFLGFDTSWPFVGDLDMVRRWVQAAAAVHPRIVVTMHIGAEGASAQRTGDSTEWFLRYNRGNPVAFARTAIEAGARFVVGHGPHVMRAMEWRDSAFVAYSLGNLATYGTFSTAEPNNRGGILCASVPRSGAPRDMVFHPTVQRPPGIVAPDPTGRAAELVDSLSRLDFPRSRGVIERADEGWRIGPPRRR